VVGGVILSNFYPRASSDARLLAVVVCLSVCLCVSHAGIVGPIKTAERRITQTTPRDNSGTLVERLKLAYYSSKDVATYLSRSRDFKFGVHVASPSLLRPTDDKLSLKALWLKGPAWSLSRDLF